MLVADLEDELDLELSERDEDTIGGVVLSELGRRGRVGDVVHIGHLALQVQEIDGNRIRTLRLTVEVPKEVAPAAGGASRQRDARACVLTNSIARATASPTATACFSRSRRSESSTFPCARLLPPTTNRIGMPIRSASLNLTPGRSSRSS